MGLWQVEYTEHYVSMIEVEADNFLEAEEKARKLIESGERLDCTCNIYGEITDTYEI